MSPVKHLLFLAVLFVIFSVTGCAAIDPALLTKEEVDRFLVVGKTTIEEVRARYGAPYRAGGIAGGKKQYNYNFQTQSGSSIISIGILITFKDNVVYEYEYHESERSRPKWF